MVNAALLKKLAIECSMLHMESTGIDPIAADVMYIMYHRSSYIYKQFTAFLCTEEFGRYSRGNGDSYTKAYTQFLFEVQSSVLTGKKFCTCFLIALVFCFVG